MIAGGTLGRLPGASIELDDDHAVGGDRDGSVLDWQPAPLASACGVTRRRRGPCREQSRSARTPPAAPVSAARRRGRRVDARSASAPRSGPHRSQRRDRHARCSSVSDAGAALRPDTTSPRSVTGRRGPARRLASGGRRSTSGPGQLIAAPSALARSRRTRASIGEPLPRHAAGADLAASTAPSIVAEALSGRLDRRRRRARHPHRSLACTARRRWPITCTCSWCQSHAGGRLVVPAFDMRQNRPQRRGRQDRSRTCHRRVAP